MTGHRLQRDRPTLTLYLGFVAWGWFLYGFSPAVALIAEEFGISRAQAGLHGTAMAVGTVLAGSLVARVAAVVGRRAAVAVGSAAVAVGIVVLLLGPSLPWTLAGVLVAAVGGNLVLSAAQPALLIHQGAAGPAAVTEANATGSGVGLLAPLAVGAGVALGWGWRPAVAVAAVIVVVLGLLVLRLPATGGLGRGSRVTRRRPAVPTPASALPPASATVPSGVTGSSDVTAAVGPGPTGASDPEDAKDTEDADARPGFSRAFSLFLAALLCGVAVEFSTTFWAPDLIVERTGADRSLATGAVAALVAGMTVARFVLGPMSLRRSPEKILLVAYVVAGIGFAVVWTATHPAVAVAGLVIAGLGYGAHYPLAVALVLRAGGERTDQAQARATVGAGVAVGIAPFALGALADVLGAHTAFLVVPLLLVGGFVSVALGLRAVQPATVRLPA